MTAESKISIDYVSIGMLKPYEHNPRFNDDAVKYVKESIKEFGFKNPIILDEDYNIIAGHTRLKAANELGLIEVPVIFARDLTEDQIKAFRLADNKTAEIATWDFETLGIELGDIELNMEPFGFDINDTMFDEDFDPDNLIDVEPDEISEEPITQLGDIYRLGEHRLMCGDSVNAIDMSKLMDGNIADISFTSPPYNAGYLSLEGDESTNRKYINNEDNLNEEEYLQFIETNISLLLQHSSEVFYNMGVVAGNKKTIIKLLNTFVDNFKDFIYWKKSNPTPTISKHVISSAIELILTFGTNSTRAFSKELGYWNGVIEGNVASSNEYADIHKATFPMYIPSEIINKFSRVGGSVLDCFGGTGTTLLACEQLKRKCYMMELEPTYCDVIVKRWEKLTGKKAELIS